MRNTNEIKLCKHPHTNQIIKVCDRDENSTEEEYLDHLTKQKVSLLKQLAINYKQLTKAKMNGQMRMVFNREKDIFESFAKEVVS